MKRTIAVAIVGIATIAASVLAPAAAQDEMQHLELLRSDIKAETVAILTEVMQFTDAEGEVFWPIYREYELERAKLGDRNVALMKDYGMHFDNMDDVKAKELVNAYFKLDEDTLKLDKKYYKKVEKALGSNTAARFVQVMNQIRLFMQVQVAAQTPLIEKMTQAAER
ncbi:MAG: hypothetical protein JSW67_02985 [Candidatus Latescibacterota bacterium]|nr:MAG: hypothetical protein JSW67_02985 [Candidatus Latescibacterota bacterium]